MSLTMKSTEDAERIFNELSQDGRVIMTLQKPSGLPASLTSLIVSGSPG